MALIDILTHWGAKKKAAQAAKTVKHGVSLHLIQDWCGEIYGTELILISLFLQNNEYHVVYIHVTS